MNWLRNIRAYLGRLVSGIPLTGSGGSIFGFGTYTTAGEEVTPEIAMTLSAVFAAVDLYGSTHAVMPCGVLDRNGSRRKFATNVAAHKLIHDKPNPEMNAGTYWRLVERHRLLWGVSFSEIEWNGRGDPKGLWPVEPWRVTVFRDKETDKLQYRIQGDNGTRTLDGEDLLIFPHVTIDGITFKSAITYGAETLGGQLAAVKTGNQYFGSGGIPQGFVKHPTRMDKPARDQFRKEWKENALENKGNIGILWEGMDFVKTQIDPEALQLLAKRQFDVLDVCRFFKVQPNKLMDYMKSAYSTNEQADLEWVKGSVLPSIVDKEQEINSKLLRYPDYYAKFIVEGLLRGDSAARGNWYKCLRELGVYSANDVCELEDLDPIGPEGDIRFVNAAYIPLNLVQQYWEAKAQPGATPHVIPGQPVEPPPGLPAPEKKPAPPADPNQNGNTDIVPTPKKRGKLSEDPFYRSELARLRRREDKAIRKAAKEPKRFLTWLDEFLPKHETIVHDILSVPLEAYVCTLSGESPEQLELDEGIWIDTKAYCGELKTALLKASEVPLEQFETSIDQLLKSREVQHG